MKSGSARVMGIKNRLFLCFAASFLLVPALGLAENRAGEIKAAFVYNFAKFIEWPTASFPSEQAPLRICAFGDAQRDSSLSLLDGRQAQGRTIVFSRIDKSEEVSGCQVLYLSHSTNGTWHSIKSALASKPVLTISEDIRFVDAGGMVSLFIENNRARFRINLSVAQGARLKVSARILQLAQDVQ